MHQLALITSIRKFLSKDDILPIEEIIFKIEILDVVNKILEFNSSEEEYRFLKLEALWITTNLAMASE